MSRQLLQRGEAELKYMRECLEGKSLGKDFLLELQAVDGVRRALVQAGTEESELLATSIALAAAR